MSARAQASAVVDLSIALRALRTEAQQVHVAYISSDYLVQWAGGW